MIDLSNGATGSIRGWFVDGPDKKTAPRSFPTRRKGTSTAPTVS
jgi:hypothetical protein